MENGAVYSPTTEAHPAPSRGARRGLSSYFTLKRLKGPLRILKFMQLVSPRAGRERGGCGAALNLAVRKGQFPHPQ